MSVGRAAGRSLQNLERIDALMESTLRTARIPGGAIAVVADGKLLFARGYGYRDLQARLPLTADTVYPIASTSKAINATLLAMLVEEGKLAWDAPVRRYLPRFSLADPLASASVTLRDLVVMRTGLPRHDWVTAEASITRAQLAERLQYLEPSAGFRERFQYNNLTVSVAGHVAEIVTGRPWDELVRSRILEPLGMSTTGFNTPNQGNFTLCYHENSRRQLVVTQPLEEEVSAPCGGTIHSTVTEMSRWLLFNLNQGRVDMRALLQPQTLAELHTPQVASGAGRSARKPYGTYALGWTVDHYQGFRRVSHGGYLYDLNSEIVLFPEANIGIVSFVNFGPPMLALLIDEHVFDLIMGLEPVSSLEQKLAQYEADVVATRARFATMRRVENTRPSHPLVQYAGTYSHPGYGQITIGSDGRTLRFERGRLIMPLQHWHYESWVFAEHDLFLIHEPHPFDPASRIAFDTDAKGRISGVSIAFEAAAAPIYFRKQEPVN